MGSIRSWHREDPSIPFILGGGVQQSDFQIPRPFGLYFLDQIRGWEESKAGIDRTAAIGGNEFAKFHIVVPYDLFTFIWCLKNWIEIFSRPSNDWILSIEYWLFEECFHFKKTTIRMTERSDIHKYSIFNFQSPIPTCPPLEGLSVLGNCPVSYTHLTLPTILLV